MRNTVTKPVLLRHVAIPLFPCDLNASVLIPAEKSLAQHRTARVEEQRRVALTATAVQVVHDRFAAREEVIGGRRDSAQTVPRQNLEGRDLVGLRPLVTGGVAYALDAQPPELIVQGGPNHGRDELLQRDVLANPLPDDA